MSTLTLKSALVKAKAEYNLGRMGEARTVHVTHTHKAAPPPPEKERTPFFVVRDGSGVAALRYWLQQRKYNTFIETTDARGKKLFGLIWDYQFGKSPSKRSERGIVLVVDKNLHKTVALMLLNHAAAETDYGQQWVQNERINWKHGRDS